MLTVRVDVGTGVAHARTLYRRPTESPIRPPCHKGRRQPTTAGGNIPPAISLTGGQESCPPRRATSPDNSHIRATNKVKGAGRALQNSAVRPTLVPLRVRQKEGVVDHADRVASVDGAARHLAWHELGMYMEAGSRSLVSISTSPSVQLVMEPPDLLGIRVPARLWLDDDHSPMGGAIASRCMALRRVRDSDGKWVELFVYGGRNHAAAYPYLTAIADRIVDERETIGEAIDYYDGLLP